MPKTRYEFTDEDFKRWLKNQRRDKQFEGDSCFGCIVAQFAQAVFRASSNVTHTKVFFYANSGQSQELPPLMSLVSIKSDHFSKRKGSFDKSEALRLVEEAEKELS